MAVDQYRTLGGVVQPKHKFEHGTLPRTTGPNDNLTLESQLCIETRKVKGVGTDAELALFDLERHITERKIFRAGIAEGDVSIWTKKPEYFSTSGK